MNRPLFSLLSGVFFCAIIISNSQAQNCDGTWPPTGGDQPHNYHCNKFCYHFDSYYETQLLGCEKVYVMILGQMFELQGWKDCLYDQNGDLWVRTCIYEPLTGGISCSPGSPTGIKTEDYINKRASRPTKIYSRREMRCLGYRVRRSCCCTAKAIPICPRRRCRPCQTGCGQTGCCQ